MKNLLRKSKKGPVYKQAVPAEPFAAPFSAKDQLHLGGAQNRGRI